MRKRRALEKNIPASLFFALSSGLATLNEISFLKFGGIYVFPILLPAEEMKGAESSDFRKALLGIDRVFSQQLNFAPEPAGQMQRNCRARETLRASRKSRFRSSAYPEDVH
jgi:hypothetical protein